MKKDIVKVILGLMNKMDRLPKAKQNQATILFFKFDNESRPVYKAINFKRWKDFVLAK